MSEREPRRMTPDEFFEWQKRQDRNFELVDGVPLLPRKAFTGLTEAQDHSSKRYPLPSRTATGRLLPRVQEYRNHGAERKCAADGYRG